MGVIKSHQYLSREQIESQAEKLLIQLKVSKFSSKRWSNLAEYIADELDIKVLWNSFGENNQGIVAAKIYPKDRQIQINENFPALHHNEGLYQSTLAHEIGHWMLHVNQEEADGSVIQEELLLDTSLERNVFLCRTFDEQAIQQRKLQTQDDFREWQAQYFASCLLMPRFKIEEVRKGRNLQNWRHLNAIKEELGVSKRNLLHRLKDLGLLIENSGKLYPGKNLKSDTPLLINE
jgi:Zn-dependent peptidase ImmA (M78 family)